MAGGSKRYFAYIRVSTQKKQGLEGISLPEQRAEIEQFAQRLGLEIVEWFEETKTAASQGRPIFTQMIRKLRRGKADGLLVHKSIAAPATTAIGTTSALSWTRASTCGSATRTSTSDPAAVACRPT